LRDELLTPLARLVDDCAVGHVLAAGHGRADARSIFNGATMTSAEALRLLGELTTRTGACGCSRRRS
jgi:hypothetical protein